MECQCGEADGRVDVFDVECVFDCHGEAVEGADDGAGFLIMRV